MANIICNQIITEFIFSNFIYQTAGNNLVLTLDTVLQQRTEELLSKVTGAAVAMDPQSGEVLAMASSPTFDQNAFVSGLSHEYWDSIRNNPDHPMENKAIQGEYPPASTFKIVTALAGLVTTLPLIQSLQGLLRGFAIGSERTPDIRTAVAVSLVAVLMIAVWGLISMYATLQTTGAEITAEQQLVRSIQWLMQSDVTSVALPVAEAKPESRDPFAAFEPVDADPEQVDADVREVGA